MKIGALSEKVGLSSYTIRYYEKMGLLDKPRKNLSGHRVYAAEDVELVNWVTCLKKSGMPLEKIKAYARAYRASEDSKVKALLELHLATLKNQRTELEHYIDVTEKKLSKLAT